jgi:membrane protein implicated in regulation of membrane protease activity
MLVFAAIAIAAFIIVAGSFFFGADHDVDHDHDLGHDLGHDVDGGDSEPTVSVFSTKVMATMLMGFGTAGAIARYYQASYVVASLAGVLFGLVLAAVMYLILELFYKQQASSLVATESAVGRTGTVTVSIEEGGTGEVGVYVEGQYRNYSASGADNRPIPKGQPVRVVRTVGSHLIVERVEGM